MLLSTCWNNLEVKIKIEFPGGLLLFQKIVQPRTVIIITDKWSNIKQLLDKVEHDIMNYQNRGLSYLPKSKAEADNAG